MSSVPQIPKRDTFRRVQRIQTVTIVWMAVEAAVSLFAAWMARSPVLLAFGGDSAIEIISAVVVLRRFQIPVAHEQAESHAARIAGVLLFALAAYVVVASAMTLVGHAEPKQSYLGIAVLILAAIFMPWLAKEKRRMALGTGSPALTADGVVSALRGRLCSFALVVVGVYGSWRVGSSDSVAPPSFVPFL